MSNRNFYLTAKERNTIVAALELAIEQYGKDLEAIRSCITPPSTNPAIRRLGDQFQGQIDDAKNLLERIEA